MKNTHEEQEEKRKSKKRKAEVHAVKFLADTGFFVGVGALAGAANYFYDFALKPIKRDKSRDNEPQEQPYMRGRAWMNNHPEREDWWAMSEDGIRIHANFIPAPGTAAEAASETAADAEPAVEHRYALCMHGYSDSAESMGQYAAVYRDKYGMNVLLPDLRGHGKSEGTYVGYGYHDRLDIIIWIDRILKRDPEAAIILHGISMGAATVMMATGEILPSCVKACIADAGYSTAMEEFTHVYNTLDQKPPVSAKILLPALRAVTLVRGGYDLADASPIDAVAHSVTPTLFIHGEADTFIPCSMMIKLFEAASCKKMCMLVPGAEHVMSVVVDPEGYWNKVHTFLESVDPAIAEYRK